MDETEFRGLTQKVFEAIETTLDKVDPDQAECQQTLGSLTITCADRSRCILSTQPSVRQIWLALASKGLAFHFNYDSVQQRWLDDKGRGVELLSSIEKYLKDAAGVEVAFLRPSRK